MKQYHYFISYNAFNSKNKMLCGMCEFLSPTKISSYEEIFEIRNRIEEQHEDLSGVVIVNYQLIRNEKY